MIVKNHKDRLFRLVFSHEDAREELLNLYNALNDTQYNDPSLIEINTLEDVLYMGMKNDLSFILSSIMSLYEQQSTYNPNMPLRQFLYSADMYKSYVDPIKRQIYSDSLIKIPAPKCVVFYNGRSRRPDTEVLKLSDAFETPSEGYEWTVTMININKGHNEKLLTACKLLKDYSCFVSDIYDRMDDGNKIEQAIDETVATLGYDDGLFARIVLKNRAEVKMSVLTEYDEEETLAWIREEALMKGIAEGEARGKAQGIVFTCKQFNATKQQTIEQIASALRLNIHEAESMVDEMW